MGRYYNFVVFFQCFLLISTELTDIHTQESQKYVDCLINYLNNLSQPLYVYEDGVLLNVQENGKDDYEIEATVTAREINDPDIVKVLRCKSHILNQKDGLTVEDNAYNCQDEYVGTTTDSPETEFTQVTESLLVQHPVKLENEVQPDNIETSGEQFVAIPRPLPSAPCIGCASNVDVNAAGVRDLALFAVKHLDRHDYNNKHTLLSVVNVQRQVQVINGVRYIIYLNIQFDNCSQNLDQDCKDQKICKISILEKPWLKLPDGSKFRGVISNNCTDEWLFDENSETLPSTPEGLPESNDDNDTIKPDSNNGYSKNVEDAIIVVHDVALQGQLPTQESTISEEHLKDIQQQIITDQNENLTKNTKTLIETVITISNLKSLPNNKENSKKYKQSTQKNNTSYDKEKEESLSPLISDDKKRAIEDLMSFFEVGYKNDLNSDKNNIRIRRHYNNNMKFHTNSFYKLKRNADNKKYLYSMGKVMVDYLNKMNPQAKLRILKEVIKAEEEFDNDDSFVYIQARVSNHCDGVVCTAKTIENEICNAIIKSTDHKNPLVLNAFCHNENKINKLAKITTIPLYDPVLNKLTSDALKKIESEISKEKALKIFKILDASTQNLSGSVTKFTLELGFLNCKNNIPTWKRLNCTNLTDFGTMICSVIVHSRAWLKKSTMDYSCIDRPHNEVFDFETDTVQSGFTDTKSLNMAKDLLEQLKFDNMNYTPRVVEVTSMSTQLVAGLLTNINFTLGLTKCPRESSKETLNCELLDDEPLRKCVAHIWERPWIEKGRLVNVTCDNSKADVNVKYVRSKRGVPGGIEEQDIRDQKYLELAEKSLLHYYKLSNVEHVHKIVKITKASTQVVAGSLTRVDFEITPTTCLIKDIDSVEISKCDIKNPTQILHCHSEIWSRPWLPDGEQITIDCKDEVSQSLASSKNQNMQNNIRKVRQVDSPLVGGIQEQNIADEKYHQIAEKSLLHYYKLSNTEQVHKIVKVTKASTQVVAGSLTRVDFDITPTTCLVKDIDSVEKAKCEVVNPAQILHCHSEVWSRPWLPDGEQITIDCKDEASPSSENKNIRKVRQVDSHVAGGIQEQNAADEKFHQIAEKSLLHYYKLSNIEQVHKIVKVTKASTQVVAGSLTRVDFDITPTTCLVKDIDSVDKAKCEVVNPAQILHCHSEVWSRPWLPDGEQITIDCKDEASLSSENKNSRNVRQVDLHVAGGIQEQNAADEKFHQIAEKTLLHYYKLSSTEQVHKIVKVTKASTQVVAGSLTRVDFYITPTTCLVKDIDSVEKAKCEVVNPAQILHCHSKVWSRPWLSDGEQITIDCKDEASPSSENKNIRKVRQVGSHVAGGIQEQNAADDKYHQLAEKSLLHYYKLSNTEQVHKIVKVTKASTQVVAGSLTRVDFEITPTTCLVKDIDAVERTKCEVRDPAQILHCHSEVWSRPWLLDGEQITIDCKSDFNIRNKRNIIGKPKHQESNKKEYVKLAEEALRKYELLFKSEYAHKVTKVDRVTTQIVSGKLTKIEFTTGQTICLAQDITHSARRKCNLQIPNTEHKCKAEIWDRPWLKINGKDITIICNIKETVNVTGLDIMNIEERQDSTLGGRNKRHIKINEEEFIDDDMSYFYADRALQHLNSISGSGNLYKLISVHNIKNGYQMNVQLVRLYIEVALTYCTEESKPQSLDRCDEIEGVSHRICFARVWPSSQDEQVLDNVDVICEDDLKFPAVTGISIIDLVETSIKEIEKSSKIKYKLVVRGEPRIIPSLKSSEPTKLNFILQPLTCHKNISNEKINKECKLSYSKPARECVSYVWLSPGENEVRKIKAFCLADKTRSKRTVDNENVEMDLEIQKFIEESIEKLEMSSLHRYKQKLLGVNNISRKFTSGRVTTIDFNVGYTSCLKYEWVDNLNSCAFLDHLPQRHCISNIWERLWAKNGNFIDVTCEDEKTPLESRMDVKNKTVTEQLAKEALKHIEAKYPHPNKQIIIRILSLEKLAVAGIHYRMKVEVGYTNCAALTLRQDCNITEIGLNKFCRVNVWIRPWVNNGANVRVSCDYQESTTADIYHHLQAEHLFSDFVATYKPKYLNDWQEMGKRFEIFKDNVRKIHEFNTHERGTATYAVTKFADLTYEEFSSMHLGLKAGLQKENVIPMPKAVIPDVEVADQFDWRDHGAVTEVKNQGSCGSCWAFSVTGNIEGQWKLKKGELISLSEQELVDCDKLDEGCNGGLPDNAYRAIEQLGGLETEDDYPYEGVDDKCVFNKSMSKVLISGAVNITSDEDGMAKWLTKNGPISIGINANAMQFYVGGISHPWKALCNPKNLDHGVLIVGYGVKDYPLFNKHLPYWTIKNSWGKSWGEQGYYRIYRGDGTCGVNQMASSAVV